MPWYLQAYLDMAYNRIEEQKKEAGRITNTDLQKKVLNYYLTSCWCPLSTISSVILDCSSFLLSLCRYITIHRTIDNMFVFHLHVQDIRRIQLEWYL